MAHPAHVPQFGNWDSNDQVPFTAVFDKARAGRGGGQGFNPNDPEQNPAAFGLKSDDSFQSVENEPLPSKQARGADAARRQSGDGYSRPGSTDGSKRGGVRENAGSDESPNHQIYQGRLGNKPGSPYRERRNSSEGGNTVAPSTPGKSRLRPGARADETPDRGAALPKFGAWDENDPSAGEGFTVIFNQARNERKAGGPNVRLPGYGSQGEASAYPNQADGSKQPLNSQHQGKKSSFWSCCFGSPTGE